MHLTKTCPILAISEKSPIFALFTRKGGFPLSWQASVTPISSEVFLWHVPRLFQRGS
nr:MAG TPA: hypothetical protein [Caudoviricetes sp.]